MGQAPFCDFVEVSRVWHPTRIAQVEIGALVKLAQESRSRSAETQGLSVVARPG